MGKSKILFPFCMLGRNFGPIINNGNSFLPNIMRATYWRWEGSHPKVLTPKIADEKIWHSHQETWDQTLSFVPSIKTRWDWQDGLLLILWLLFPKLRMSRHDIPIRKYGTKRWALSHLSGLDGTGRMGSFSYCDCCSQDWGWEDMTFPSGNMGPNVELCPIY